MGAVNSQQVVVYLPCVSMENNSSREVILRGQGKIFVLQFLLVIILSVSALVLSRFAIGMYDPENNFYPFMNHLSPALVLLFILAFVLSLILSSQKRIIKITKDYVEFPKSYLHKYFFKKEEIERMAILIPWLWRIGKYFGTGSLFITVFYKENGILKNAGQAVYEDFDPEKVVSLLQEFGYKVDEDAKGAIWGT